MHREASEVQVVVPSWPKGALVILVIMPIYAASVQALLHFTETIDNPTGVRIVVGLLMAWMTGGWLMLTLEKSGAYGRVGDAVLFPPRFRRKVVPLHLAMDCYPRLFTSRKQYRLHRARVSLRIAKSLAALHALQFSHPEWKDVRFTMHSHVVHGRFLDQAGIQKHRIIKPHRLRDTVFFLVRSLFSLQVLAEFRNPMIPTSIKGAKKATTPLLTVWRVTPAQLKLDVITAKIKEAEEVLAAVEKQVEAGTAATGRLATKPL